MYNKRANDKREFLKNKYGIDLGFLYRNYTDEQIIKEPEIDVLDEWERDQEIMKKFNSKYGFDSPLPEHVIDECIMHDIPHSFYITFPGNATYQEIYDAYYTEFADEASEKSGYDDEANYYGV